MKTFCTSAIREKSQVKDPLKNVNNFKPTVKQRPTEPNVTIQYPATRKLRGTESYRPKQWRSSVETVKKGNKHWRMAKSWVLLVLGSNKDVPARVPGGVRSAAAARPTASSYSSSTKMALWSFRGTQILVTTSFLFQPSNSLPRIPV